ncbi:MAG: outer membrane lipoprotein carrier protein LolA [Lactobacillales bacterium]|nr:outer membrane lipoprotein carrier protein LolA [Lactobacillales bacterium]
MKIRNGILLMMICCFITGCFGNNNNGTDKFIKKVEKTKNYYLTGELLIINNEDTYKYDVSVSYKDKDYYKVELINKTNNHEQIILRNDEGVYVLTPSLNKSFKFQSEWPYNNSQSYLLQSLVTDIENDKNKKVTKNKKETIITTNVNYSNNKNLKNQKIYLNKSSMVTKVEVYDEDNNLKIKMTFDDIDLKSKFDKDYFKLEQNVSYEKVEETSKTLEDIVYPMYMPTNTYLASEDKVLLENGERVILTFLGDSPFTLIEETATVSDELETINMYGEPELLIDTVGALSDNSITWISDGVSYYATSETLKEDELLEVVKSISAVPVSK